MNLLYSFLLVSFILSIAPSKSVEPTYLSCPANNETDGNIQIMKNVDQTLSTLAPSTIENFFNTTSTGEHETQIHGLAQCRGDVPKDICSDCIKNATNTVRAQCWNRSEAIVMYDNCLLRYSTKDFIGDVDPNGLVLYNTGNVTDFKHFNKIRLNLMNNIISEAARQSLKMGKGRTKLHKPIDDYLYLYALVQCTRDLSDLNCDQCLTIARAKFGGELRKAQGFRVLYKTCYIRYELYPFYYPLDDPTNGTMGMG
ncbi:hypothetical protein OROGR_027903 [Orobanche gracilis]